MNRITVYDSQITAHLPETLKIFTCDENQASMLSSASQNWVPFSYVSAYFLGLFFVNVLQYRSRISFFFVANSLKQILPTVILLLKKSLTLTVKVSYESVEIFFSLKLVSVRQEARKAAGTKFPLCWNSTIFWTARCLISGFCWHFPDCHFSFLSDKLNDFSFSFGLRHFGIGQYGANNRFWFSCTHLLTLLTPMQSSPYIHWSVS